MRMLPLMLATFGFPAAGAEETVLLQDPPAEQGLVVKWRSSSHGWIGSRVGDLPEIDRPVKFAHEHVWQRTYVDDALGGTVTYRIIKDETVVELDGEPRKLSGPLEGLRVEGLKNGAGSWVFSLPAGSTALGGQAYELERLGAFENHRWLPNRKVAIGESWNFTPAYLRSALRHDLPHAEMVGVMKLRAIEKNSDGSRQAVIDCVIRGGGESVSAGGEASGAEGLLAGNVTVNLDRPEAAMHLSGRLVTAARSGAERSGATMPITINVFLEGLGNPAVQP